MSIKHQLYYTISELHKASPDFHMVDFHEPWDSVGKCFFFFYVRETIVIKLLFCVTGKIVSTHRVLFGQ